MKSQVEWGRAYPLTISELFELLQEKDHRFKTTGDGFRFKTSQEEEHDLKQKFKALKTDATGIDYEITSLVEMKQKRENLAGMSIQELMLKLQNPAEEERDE